MDPLIRKEKEIVAHTITIIFPLNGFVIPFCITKEYMPGLVTLYSQRLQMCVAHGTPLWMQHGECFKIVFWTFCWQALWKGIEGDWYPCILLFHLQNEEGNWVISAALQAVLPSHVSLARGRSAGTRVMISAGVWLLFPTICYLEQSESSNRT